MSKADSIIALIDSAVHNFSKYGYEGASLRDITARAGVPLSTIHMYFGSKAELYAEVGRHVWSQVDKERSILLAAALAKAGHEPPDLGDLIHALALPIVRRALGDCDHGRDEIFVLRERVASMEGGKSGALLNLVDLSMARWIDAMGRCCPKLARHDAIWAFSFVVGTIYSWQLLDHRYDNLLGPDSERTVENVTGDIVAFGAAGVRALIERSAPCVEKAAAAAH